MIRKLSFSRNNYLNIVFVLFISIMFSRILSIILFNPYIDIFGINIYFFYIGLIFSIFSITGVIILQSSRSDFLFIFLIFCIGIVIDQLVFLIGEEANAWYYWDSISILWTFIIFSIFTLFILINGRYKQKINYLIDKKLILKILTTIGLIILTSRMFVYLFPGESFHILTYEIHHINYGIILVMIGLLIFSGFIPYIQLRSKNRLNLSILIISSGIGFIIDEFTFRLLGGITDADYWSSNSILGAIVIYIIIVSYVLILYHFKERIPPVYSEQSEW